MNTNIALFALFGAVKTVQLTQATLERPLFNIILGILVGNVYGLVMEFLYYILNINDFGSIFITFICVMAIINNVGPQIYSIYTKGMYEHKCSYLHNVEWIVDLPFFAYYKRYNEKAHVQDIIDEQQEEIEYEDSEDEELLEEEYSSEEMEESNEELDEESDEQLKPEDVETYTINQENSE